MQGANRYEVVTPGNKRCIEWGGKAYMKCHVIAIFLALLMGRVAAAQEDMPKIRVFDLNTIEALGRSMYAFDIASARATDILFEQKLDMGQYPIKGWVVTEEEGGPLVTFVGEFGGDYMGFFDIRPQASGDRRFRMVDARALSAEEVAQFKARQLTRPLITHPCSNRYNSIVIKDPTSPSWLVCWIAATADPGVILVGGHYRFTVTPDGSAVESADRLSLSCLTADPNEVPEDASVAALYVTHLVSDTPVETHVFLNLLNRVDFAVGTGPETLWSVSEGHINRIDD